MRALDGFTISNASTSSALTKLSGGLYAVSAIATWSSGSVTLEVQAADESTMIAVGSSTTFSANGFATVYLPPGWYQLVVATSTAVYARVIRVPFE